MYNNTLTEYIKEITRSLAMLVIIILVSGGLSVVLSTSVARAASVTITTPQVNQVLPVGNVTVSGVATPNSTVVVSRGDVPASSVIADGAGNWTTSVNNLATGTNTLTAKVITNDQYAYFASTADFTTGSISRIRLSDNALNPGGGGWPVSTSSPYVMLATDVVGNYTYAFELGNNAAIPGRLNLNSPADPTPITGYSANSGANAVIAFALGGTKVYIPNTNLGSVSVVDVATNTQIGSINVTGVQIATLGPDGKVYTTNNSGVISVINPSTDVVEDTYSVSCPTAGDVGTLSFPMGQDYFYAICAQDGIIRKISFAIGDTVGTIDVSSIKSTLGSIVPSLDNKRLYLSSIYGSPGDDEIVVYDIASDTVVDTITLSAATFSGILTSDGQYLYVHTLGAFDTTNIDVVSTVTNSVVDTIDTSSVGIPGLVLAANTSDTNVAETSVTFQVGVANANQDTGSLAETGVKAYITTPLATLLLSGTTLLLIRKTKRSRVFRQK